MFLHFQSDVLHKDLARIPRDPRVREILQLLEVQRPIESVGHVIDFGVTRLHRFHLHDGKSFSARSGFKLGIRRFPDTLPMVLLPHSHHINLSSALRSALSRFIGQPFNVHISLQSKYRTIGAAYRYPSFVSKVSSRE